MRIRQIKPEFYLDDELAHHCSRDARLLFTGLWVIADRKGRLYDRPARIKAQIFPYDSDMTAEFVDRLLCELASGNFIIRYSSNGSGNLIQIRTFEKHQHCHIKESDSKLPGPDDAGSHISQAPDKHGASTVQAPEQHLTCPSTSTSTSTSTSPPAEGCGEVAEKRNSPKRVVISNPEAIELAHRLALRIHERDAGARSFDYF